MTRRLEIRVEASRHIAEAFSWYEGQRPGLGWTFRDKLDAAFRLLHEHPEAGPEVYRGVRRVLVDHFPYAVYYTLPKDAIAILRRSGENTPAACRHNGVLLQCRDATRGARLQADQREAA